MMDRFWSKVDIRGGDECWSWKACVNPSGYGSFRWKGRCSRAHRVAYMLCHGEIPKGDGHHGTVVMHECDQPLCCNPKHLKLGTQGDNIADMKAKGRRLGKMTDELNHNMRIAPVDVRKIRSDPRSHRVVAAEYGIDHSTVSDIKNGKSRRAA